MIGPPFPRPARRAVLVHTFSTALVTVVVAVAALAVSTTAALHATRANAAAIADTVAHTVAAPLALTDITSNASETRAAILTELQPFIDAGVIDRAKIWHVDGDEVVVLFSDEPRNEGVRRPFDPDLAARLDAGEVVVLDVPDDAEHRHEFGRPGILEAFIGFEDALGEPIRLELYLPAPEQSALSGMLAAMLPVAVVGPLVLGGATLPLSARLARRVQRSERDRQELIHTALAASDRERQRLAARLHDGILPDLASVGLTLENFSVSRADESPSDAAALARLGDRVDAEIDEIRALLTELTPPAFDGSLAESLKELVNELVKEGTRIDLHVDDAVAPGPDAAALVYQVARELIRNALDHAQPTIVRVHVGNADGRVTLEVTDDGNGFDTAHPPPDGHLGLRLIRLAVTLNGGDIAIDSSFHGTEARAAVPDDIVVARR